MSHRYLELRRLPIKEAVEGSTLTGDIRQHCVESNLFGKRHILVYLPPGYTDNDTWRYPFALLQDGQNVFDESTSAFGTEWGVDEVAERLISEQAIEPVILVAVYNSQGRVEEYTPFPNAEDTGGSAELYRDFLVHDVIPFLEAQYSVSAWPERRAVIGSSLGGLISLFLGWTTPQTFGLIGALSPSLWWGNRGFITRIAGDPTPDSLPKIWLDGGTSETGEDRNRSARPDLIDDLRTMRAVFLAHGYSEEVNLAYREIEGATHDEGSWSRRIGNVLQFLFPKRSPLVDRH